MSPLRKLACCAGLRLVIDTTLAPPSVQGYMQVRTPFAPARLPKHPGAIGSFAVRRVSLATVGGCVVTERHAEKIAAKGPEHHWQGRIGWFVGPGSHMIRTNAAIFPVERDWTELAAVDRDVRLNVGIC